MARQSLVVRLINYPSSSPSWPIMAEVGEAGPHPLHVARSVVDRVLLRRKSLIAELASQADTSLVDAECLIRVAALRVLSHTGSGRSMAEQLRYNPIYRWFVGLESIWFREENTACWVSDGRHLHHLPAAEQIMQALISDEGWREISQNEYFAPSMAELLPCCDSGGRIEGAEDLIRVDRFARVREYVVGNIQNPGLNVNDLASALCVSRRTLYTIFAGRGTTPARLIRGTRLERAYARLSDQLGQQKITAVAFDCGFHDYATFSRCFKARFGLSPQDLRRGRGAMATRSRGERKEPVSFSPQLSDSVGASC